MAKHALVIGINDYDTGEKLTRLEWCVRDAKEVAKRLEKLGFKAPRRRRQPSAGGVTRLSKKGETTRRAILDAVDELIGKVEADPDPPDQKVVVFYFAGHGSYGELDGGRFESIVPSDSSRGGGPVTDILDWEIDGWIRRLQRSTDNVTLIFDSCHSGGLGEVRGEEGVRRAPPFPAEALAGETGRLPPEPVRTAHREATRGKEGWLSRLRRGSVVLAACEASRKAYENKRWKHGVFTHFLLEELDKLDGDTTWRDLATRIGHRVRADGNYRQHPRVDGDVDRVVFSHRRLERSPSLMVLSKAGNTIQLSGGALDGVEPESRWTIRSAEARRRNDGDEVAVARIRSVGLRTSTAEVDPSNRVEKGQRAFATAVSASPVPPSPVSGERLKQLKKPGGAWQKAVDERRFRMRWVWGDDKTSVTCWILLDADEPSGTSPPSAGGVVDLTEAAEGVRVSFWMHNGGRSALWFTLLQITPDGEIGLLWPRTDHLEPSPGGVTIGARKKSHWGWYLDDDEDFKAFREGVPLASSTGDGDPLDLLVVLSEHPVDLAFLELPAGAREAREGSEREGDWAILRSRVRPPAAAESRETATAAIARRRPEAERSPMEFDDLPLAVAAIPVDSGGPFEKKIEKIEFQARLQALRRAARISPRSSGGGLLRRKDVAERRVRELGRQLSRVLLAESGPQRAPAGERGTRLRLAFDRSGLASKLAALPWEALYRDSDGAGVHLGLDPATAIVRSLAPSGDRGSPQVTETPFRLLGMVAQPQDQAFLDASREQRLMKTAVQHLIDNGTLELSWVDGETLPDLVEALASGIWHAFHFIGHGGSDDEAYIALAGGGAGGRSTRKIFAGQLAETLSSQSDLRLVVLNSCKGAVAEGGEQFSSFGPALEDRGIPAVVAMQAEISDRAAIHFSALLYEGIAAGLPVDAAVTRGRRAIAEDLSPTVEWVTPVLQLGSSDGKLLRPDVNGAILRRVSGSEDFPRGSLRGGIRRDWAEALRRKVRDGWVEKMPSLAGDPSRRHLPRADRRLERKEGSRGVTEKLDRPLGDVLAELEGSMVILGAPGAGKTVALYEVARDLLAMEDDQPPVPVLFPLSEWTRPGESLIDFLTVRMSVLYGVPEKESREWLEAGRLVLLLDGLDEVGAERPPSEARDRRNACAAAINELAEMTRPAGLVVTCGLREYLEIDDRHRLAVRGAVRLEVLTREQLLEEVATEEGGTELERLLRRHPALQIQVRSPLWLSFLHQIAPRLDDVGPELVELDTAGEIREALLEAYVDSCFEGRREGSAS